MADTLEITRGLDPMPRPIYTKARDNDRRPWSADEDETLIRTARSAICSGQGALEKALPHRRFGVILDRRAQLMEAGLLTIPAPL
jgi:hypothetical protein